MREEIPKRYTTTIVKESLNINLPTALTLVKGNVNYYGENDRVYGDVDNLRDMAAGR